MCLKSRSKENKGYILSTEAIICLSILCTAIIGFKTNPNPNLNQEFIYQQAQDIVESCLNKPKDEINHCLGKINQINPSMKYGEGEIVINRKTDGEVREFRFTLHERLK